MARLEHERVALVDHRPVGPHGGVDGTHAVAAGVQPVLPVAGTVQDPGVGGEHFAEGGPRPYYVLAGQQGLVAGTVHGPVLRRRLADQQGPHHRSVVAPLDATPLQCQLVDRIQVAAARGVAHHERTRARADDHLVAGVVTATTQHGALHVGQDPGLGDARPGQADGHLPGVVGQLGCPTRVGHFLGALHPAEFLDQRRGVGPRQETVQLGLQQAPVGGPQAVGVQLDAHAGTGQAQVVEHVPQVQCRVHAVDVDVAAHVGHVGRVGGRPPVGCPVQQGDPALACHDHALEAGEAEGVVPGQPVHRLLLEHEQGVQPGGPDGSGRPVPAGEHLVGREVDGHGAPSGAGVSRSGAPRRRRTGRRTGRRWRQPGPPDPPRCTVRRVPGRW